ncbi:MAG: UDP-N-acetylglucosamine 2-epimerase (non-hydrolyzing) [Nitrospirales bacterium]|nr:MAG: UDP-N-acetylglucosamine 2-epimerase (non-hydrolyzing) [Nitrospirales bacterium]
MKIVLVAGARPNFMKVSAIIDAIQSHNASGGRHIEYRLVHTGQHYDAQMSQTFFTDLGIPKPDVDMEVGSSSHAQQTGEIIKRFEFIMLDEQPDVVLVVGDVNSTIACSLVASKMMYPNPTATLKLLRPRIAHVEAGLRSFDREMPEEVNRVLTDVVSDFLFTTERSAEKNLKKEGIPKDKVHFVGNTMVDSLLKHRKKSQESAILERLGLSHDDKGVPREYGVMTLHRPSNVDDLTCFQPILEALKELSQDMPMVFPVHPRTMKRIQEFHLESNFASLIPQKIGGSGLYCIEPLGYLDFLRLTANAKLVLTDSGGLQEETTILGVPCVTLRENTERPITITQGTNVLAGTMKDQILIHARQQLTHHKKHKRPKFWDGHAGQRIVEILDRSLCGTS